MANKKIFLEYWRRRRRLERSYLRTIMLFGEPVEILQCNLFSLS
jgi:hypothetical protein